MIVNVKLASKWYKLPHAGFLFYYYRHALETSVWKWLSKTCVFWCSLCDTWQESSRSARPRHIREGQSPFIRERYTFKIWRVTSRVSFSWYSCCCHMYLLRCINILILWLARVYQFPRNTTSSNSLVHLPFFLTFCYRSSKFVWPLSSLLPHVWMVHLVVRIFKPCKYLRVTLVFFEIVLHRPSISDFGITIVLNWRWSWEIISTK